MKILLKSGRLDRELVHGPLDLLKGVGIRLLGRWTQHKTGVIYEKALSEHPEPGWLNRNGWARQNSRSTMAGQHEGRAIGVEKRG